ncbi:MAG: DUF6427 family protein [Bacteroidales bacterium]|nr:DUF6427 family protein [Bacteroidales bacterium]
MFQFLQRNTSFNLILLPIIVLLLWGSNLLHPEVFVSHYYDETPMIFYQPLMAIQHWNVFAGQLVALLLITANILLLIRTNTSIRLIEKRSIVYVLLYILFSSCLQDFRQLNPMQPALFFVILGMVALFKMYKNERELRTIFECGVYFSIATLFYAPTIYLTILIFIGLITLVSFYWRQWLAAIVGVLTPFALLFTLAFCFDALPQQIAVWRANLLTIHSDLTLTLVPIIYSVFLALVFIISAFYSLTRGIKKVSIRKFYLIFAFFLAIILSAAFFIPYVSMDILFFGLLPVAIYITNYMVNIRQPILAEVLFMIIIAFVVLVHIFPNIPLSLEFLHS